MWGSELCFNLLIQEKIAKLEADRDMMLEEKLQMDRDITKWEVDFKKNTGREPTEADRSGRHSLLFII